MVQQFMVSIDPGTVHNGVARWHQGDDGLWVCDAADEMDPEGTLDAVRGWIAGSPLLRTIAVEGFYLRPGKDALRQAGSAFGMVEVIGTLRHMCRWEGREFVSVTPQVRKTTYTRVKAAGYRFVGRAQSADDHRVSAECVGIAAMKMRVADIFPDAFTHN